MRTSSFVQGDHRLKIMESDSLLLLFLILALGLYSSCDACDEDQYGDVLILGVPIHTQAENNVIHVGDTVKVISEFSKTVEVVGYRPDIYLEGFDFLLSMILADVSDSTTNFQFSANPTLVTGRLDTISSSNGITNAINEYALTFAEDEEQYRFHVNLAFDRPGVYLFRFREYQEGFQYLDHPAVYKCEGEPRQFIEVFVRNPAGGAENYELQFLQKSRVELLTNYYDLDLYQENGMFTIEVTPVQND